MNKLNSRTISINALAIALVCLSTMFLQFPIPLGYAHLGNCFILISGILPTAQASLSTCSRFVQPLPALSVSLSWLSAISSAAPFFTAASIPVQLRFRALLWKALSASFSSMSSVPLCRLHICQSIFSGSLSVSRMYLFQERN